MNIGTQLRLGLGVILAFVALLGVLAWSQTNQLWLNTKTLYDHPHQVRRAIGELEADILTMHLGMKDLAISTNDREIADALQSIETRKANAFRQFDILYDRYLGPRGDITTLHDDFVKWNVIREETIRIFRTGKIAEAAARTQYASVGGAQAKRLKGHITKVSDFARSKGDELYQSATALHDLLNRQLIACVAAILLLSLTVSWLLLKGIRTPLAALTAAADQFRIGRTDTRSEYISANEFGRLSAAFNSLADTIQTELQVKESAAEVSEVMLREDEAKAFCLELLKILLHHTGSQLGAVFLLNERKTDFEHFESIGLAHAGRASFSATRREGEFGPALACREIQYITDIPPDTRFVASMVAGDFVPREIITIPILSGNDVAAMISLACVRAYSARAVRLVNEIWVVLAARFNGVLALRQLRAFSERLEHQNRELDTQKQELTAQKDELSEQNIELETQKRQLDEANRMKSVFLSNMSHELRTPLNSVIALTGVLNRRLVGVIPAEEYSYLEIIERNGKNLLALINDILDLSRIEAGREDIHLQYFSVRELAAEVVSMIEPQAREKGIDLLNRLGDDLPLVRSDFTKCRHILQNLVANAVKFTGQGHVELSSMTVDDNIEISVADTGIGIQADQIRYIFDEFRQADETTTKNYGGTGLGLSIAKKYAELLHSRITVESVPGKGSTFILTLPMNITGPAADPQVTKHVDADNIPPGNGKRILVVEDNESAIIQLKDILTVQGYTVRAAKNGREALDQIEKMLPDAVILDLMMPEVDGFEVLRKIRSVEKTAHLPVLILTAKHVTKEELNFLTGNHIHQLIQKGDISRADLLAAVGKMVAPHTAPHTAKARPSAARPAARISGKPVVLVVEDNPDNMMIVRALLQDTVTLIEATDGKTGIELAKAHMPDLILMDISLPVMDGFAALDAIRKDDSLHHIPVIAVTASAMSGNREEILKHGFDGYISKPVDSDELMRTVRGIMNDE
jgi:signal transduction histidine kinase/CheY-like chemotaxis protein